MRITIWLSIATFVTTLYWPHLLNGAGLLGCVLVCFVFLCWPKWRYLAIIPFTAVYFTIYIYITLLGGIGALINIEPTHSPSPILNGQQQPLLGFISKALNDQDNSITVRIKSLTNTKNTGYFIATLTSINEQTCYICPLIEVRWFKPTLQVQIGQEHTFKARIKPLQGKANPDGFDRQKWRYSQHIGFVANIKQHLAITDPSISFRGVVYQKAVAITDGMSQQGSLIALIFADKSLMSHEVKNTIKQLGIAHLFAISGLHIGLLYIFSLFIFKSLMNTVLPNQWLGWCSWRLINTLSFTVCLGYGYISGFSLPTQRALFMLFMAVLMLSSRRKVSVFDLLMMCLWLMLMLDPMAILSSSLWLSFTAMTAILLFIWMVQRQENTNLDNLSLWRQKVKKGLTFIKWLVILQLVLTLFMLPIQLLNFSAISVYSLAINLFAIPIFSWFIIPFTLLGSISLMLFEPIGLLMLTTSNYLLDTFLNYTQGLSSGYILLANQYITYILSSVTVLLFCLCLVLFNRFFVVNQFTNVVMITLLASFTLIRTFELSYQQRNSWQVEIFDVGQGLAVLIKNAGHALLYDTGASYGQHYAVAESTILPYLHANGIDELDYLIISHSDNDHAGGRFVISRHLRVNHAYSGEARLLNNDNSKLKYLPCVADQSFKLGKLIVSILAPLRPSSNNNDSSCVVKISDGKHSVLLTGDISQSVEQQLVKKFGQSNGENAFHSTNTLYANILIAPHHGSKTSSSMAFIKAVNPDWVVFSAGYKNRWRFPIASVVARYELLGIKQLTTANSGFIRFNMENQHIEVKTFREDLAAYWYHRHIAF
jgi:competence protein ComEC